MRWYLALVLFLLAAPAFATPPQHVYFPGPISGTTSGLTGTFQNLIVGPGQVSITGGPATASSITGIANINGQMWANYFPGADIGVKVNNAIAALGRSGGIIHIAAGQYQFTTTIQCPLNSNAPIIIQGDGQTNLQSSDLAEFTKGTLLQYTGNGDAVNQLIVSASGTNPGPFQNYAGCQLRDITLDGSLAGANAIGFHFGGTIESGALMTTIANFRTAGVELEDPPYQWTERYIFRDVQVINDQIGLWFHNDLNGQTSFGHGIVHIWTNTEATQSTIRIDGGALVYSGEFVIDGNLQANNAIMVDINGSQFVQNFFNPRAECQTVPGPCIMTNAVNNSAVGNDVMEEQGAGYSSNATTGSYMANTVLDAQGLGLAHTATTLFTNENVALNLAPRIAHGSVNSRLNTFQVANGGVSSIVSNCSGMISVTEQGASGDAGLYMCGGGVCSFLGSSNNAIWVASTVTPAAGRASVAAQGPLFYAIYNNTGATDTFGATTICSRDSN